MSGKEKIQRDKWYHRSVVYHIYPRSFKDSNGDGVGDLKGIIEKLGYLNDGTKNSLGVGAIWLSPIYKSPMADHGYDVSDYYDIDPIFGDLKTFDKLISGAHKRGIEVIMDLIINHTSKEHSWFKESRSSKDNPKRDWYIWRDPKPDGSPPNNWISVFGGPAWTYDEETGQYYFHSFLPDQPDLNWRNEEVQKEMKRVAKFWLDRGVDGFRIDAIEHLIEDEELRDDPKNPDFDPEKHEPYHAVKHVFSKGQDDLVQCINSVCDVVGDYGDKFIVSEAYLNIPKMMEMFNACANRIHAPFNFNLMEREWEAEKFKKFIDDFELALRPDDWPNYVFGNHDRTRVATRLSEGQTKITALLLLTLRGMPFLYYGDEIGMQDVSVSEEEVQDPYALRVGDPELSRDPQRSPMQWSSEKYAGFSEAEPWLPLSKDFKERNVETQAKDPTSIFNLYRTLINYRNNSEPLMVGSYWSLDSESKDILSYIREYDGKKVLVMLNFSEQEIKESLPVPLAKIVLSSFMDKESGVSVSGEITFRPNEGYVFEVEE